MSDAKKYIETCVQLQACCNWAYLIAGVDQEMEEYSDESHDRKKTGRKYSRSIIFSYNASSFSHSELF